MDGAFPNADDLLRRVSRSFFLSLRLVPREVRGTLALAYLLARASDSIADASEVPIPVRRELLERLPDRWEPEEVLPLGCLPAAERDLLEALPHLLAELESSPDSAEIRAVWRTILEGQQFDLMRFAENEVPLTIDEAAHYTGLVAGCVGKFWTEICFKHLPRYSRCNPEELSRLGWKFGCGLQWVNILRDRHADAAAGRVYVRECEFENAMARARHALEAGALYANQVRWLRVRVAVRLPLHLARRTLDLIAANPQARAPKASRAFVWWSVLRSLWDNK